MFDILGALTQFVNFLINGLVVAVNLLVIWLPNSPFQNAINGVRSSIGSELLGYVNYFLPISEILTILTAWVSAIVLYYGYSVIMRWVKAIS